MKYPILAAAIAAIALAAAPADAKNNKHKNKHKHRGNDRVLVVDRDYRPDRVIVVDRDHRRGHPHDFRRDPRRHDNGLHLGWYKQHWKRGERIPVTYLEPRYYIDDYRAYGLSAPPRGYQWVRPMDDRYLLVQVATGLVLEALGY